MLKIRNKQIRCAFFDVDGTLVEGFMIQSFLRFLADVGFIQTSFADRTDEIILSYQSGKITYRNAAETVPKIYALALKGKNRASVKSWAGKFMEYYVQAHLFSFSENLVREVGNLVDVKVALSGSPHEVVEELGKMGFDKMYGSLFKITGHRYTGEVSANLILGEEKAELAKNLSRKFNIDLERSIAFGDTDQDELLLNMVGLPIALNPNRELREICESKGWKRFHTAELEKERSVIELVNSWLETKRKP